MQYVLAHAAPQALSRPQTVLLGSLGGLGTAALLAGLAGVAGRTFGYSFNTSALVGAVAGPPLVFAVVSLMRPGSAEETVI